MIIPATDCDYLAKESGISWADCEGQDPVVGSTDLLDTENLYFGYGFWQSGQSDNWGWWQAFVRFEDVPTNIYISAAEVRLYLIGAINSAVHRARIITGGYGDDIDADDWNPTGPASEAINTDSYTETDGDGNTYLRIPFTAAMLTAMRAEGATVDIHVGAPSGAPADPEDQMYRNRAHAVEILNSDLKPALVLTTKSARERILAALQTRLSAIDEYDGYIVTPSIVSRRPVDFATLDALQFPAVYLDPQPSAEGEDTLGVKGIKWRINIMGGVYGDNPAQIRSRLQELISDIFRALVLDVGTDDPLELDFVDLISVAEIETADGVIDDNRASVRIGLDVFYSREYGTA